MHASCSYLIFEDNKFFIHYEIPVGIVLIRLRQLDDTRLQMYKGPLRIIEVKKIIIE